MENLKWKIDNGFMLQALRACSINRLLFVVVLFVFSMPVIGQNLIANAAFEDINFCHKYDENCSPKGWRSTTPKLFGYHKMETERFISLLLLNEARKDDRKYAQTELLCPLEAGKRYEISMRIRPNHFRIGSFGMVFKQQFSTSNKGLLGLNTDQFLSLKLPPKAREAEWINIQQEFVATGEEHFLVLGNFLSDEATEIALFDEKKYKKGAKHYDADRKRVKYAFDDLQLICLDSTRLCDTSGVHLRLYTDSIRHSMHRLLPPEPIAIVPTPPVQDTTTIPIPKAKKPLPVLSIPGKLTLHDLKYATNAWEVQQEDVPELEALLALMQEHPKAYIKIFGYTDSIGSEVDNLALSQHRAQGVYDYLQSRGIPLDRMQLEGKGEANPIADNMFEAGRALNRRVEILILE